MSLYGHFSIHRSNHVFSLDLVRVAAGTALLLVALLFQVLLQMYNELLFTFFIFTLTLYALLQARNGYESTLVP